MEIDKEEHLKFGMKIWQQIAEQDMPTWQFGALMTSLISCWLYNHVAPDERTAFVAKLTESLHARFIKEMLQ